jgi:hypothetical protein
VVEAPCDQVQGFVCSLEQIDELRFDLGTALGDCLNACLEDALFTCGDGNVIPGEWVCDGEPDCFPEGSDELDCEDERSDLGRFECADGTDSVPNDWQCDGFPDCADGSDESTCPTFTCEEASDTQDAIIVPADWQCDGFPDCDNARDEEGCPPRAELLCDGVVVGDSGGGTADGAAGMAVPVPGPMLVPPMAAGAAAPTQCIPGMLSTPGQAADPCPQDGTQCEALGGLAVASCGPDGLWGICECQMPM